MEIKMKDYTTSLFEFIKKSPSAYHTVASVKARLVAEGYVELCEGSAWSLVEGGKYFVTRNGSSVIAFRCAANARGFVITASHSDSPSFRVKASGESCAGAYTRLPVERYGGMILYSWFDRPLSVAGRVVVRTEDGIASRLINIDRDLLVIPSVAIHLNRTVNEKFSPNPAQDLIPLLGAGGEHADLVALIAAELNAKAEDIISHDLFLYARDDGRVLGADGELILSPRLDDLECVYSSLEAFLDAKEQGMIPVLAVFDNEEVGSDTKQGAASTFLFDTLSRIFPQRDEYLAALASSYMISADNAHAKHPNHPELSDQDNAPTLNGGVVVKYNANQKYTTDSVSAAIFTEACRKAGVKHQSYYNRADMPGGSTLGSIASTKVSVSTVDVGLPQLAMHSAVETAGTRDLSDMISVLTRLYSSYIDIKSDKIVIK